MVNQRTINDGYGTGMEQISVLKILTAICEFGLMMCDCIWFSALFAGLPLFFIFHMLKFGMAETCSGAFLAFVGEARGQLRNTFFPITHFPAGGHGVLRRAGSFAKGWDGSDDAVLRNVGEIGYCQ